ncbi:hypothetical protein CEXT_265211 [Caerostris extrusa]|uniref:Uncharacterized protein n=1 Tax=Caerostris extrusa TaxID=172846 RepID=A0AAV4NBD9_CAEEX|nr:hypothetical protein CEXT_265211 [Caerostris extrusa]
MNEKSHFDLSPTLHAIHTKTLSVEFPRLLLENRELNPKFRLSLNKSSLPAFLDCNMDLASNIFLKSQRNPYDSIEVPDTVKNSGIASY